ncbi:MAG: hypothetical protein L7S63_02320 [Flavobacteriales bacterium]|jgi:septal ring factor EnvC (AmiA/AmiB activator)|nr:hypothetical protein [Flavobacteriales bacterium]
MEKLYEHTLQKQLADQNDKIAKLEDQNARMEAQAAEIKDQNSRMEDMMRQLLARSEGATSSNVAVAQGDHCTALVDNKKITINVFGKEEVGHISAERIMAEEIFPDGHSSEGTMSEPSGLEEIS